MHVVFDILYALRLLRKAPAFTVLSIMVLSGGLAMSLFTFGFLYTLTSKPLPLPEQGTLYRASLFWHDESFGDRRYLPAYEAAQIRAKSTVFAEHGVWQNKTVHLSLGENNLIASAVRTSPNIFRVSRTEPLLGRGLEPDDGKAGASPIVVISYAIWRGQFAGRDDIIGQSVYINDELVEIVGVMPTGYRFPISHDLWLPISERILDPLMTDRERVEFYGRLSPGVTEEQAEQQIFSIVSDAFSERARTWPGVELIRSDVGLFQQFDVPQAMKIFALALNMLVFFILLLAAINVGNLLLARAIRRHRESAVRAALGAPQWRLVSQLMWEGMIITLAGTLFAIAVVDWLLGAVNVYFHSLMNDELAFWYVWELDSTIIAAAAAFAATTIFVACFLPAWKASRQNFNAVLRDGTSGAQGKEVGRMSRFLVTMQISAICMIMILGTVVSLKVNQLTDIQLGYDVKNLYFSIVDLPAYRYEVGEQKSLFFERLQSNLEASPAIAGSSVRFDFSKLSVAVEGKDYSTDADKPNVQVYSAIGSPEFMGPRLVSGRYLDVRDNTKGALTAVVSESMAERHWIGSTPIDQRLEVLLEGTAYDVTIVGVVSNTSDNPFEKTDVSDELYLSGYQFPAQRGTVFFERTSGEVVAEDHFFRIINGIDSQLDILTVEDWELEISSISKMTKAIRNTIVVSGLFSLILAMSGIYGLTAFSVQKRSHEIGIRRALGATDRNILGLFTQQGGKLLLMGLLVGISLSALLLFGVSSVLGLPGIVYAVIYGAVLFSLSTIVIAAIVIPARRAVNLQPSSALRYE